MKALCGGDKQKLLRPFIRAIALTGICLAACVLTVAAQQPFVTDDADVTDRGKFHLEFGNEFDGLQSSSLPITDQSGAHLTLAYGLVKNVEVSITGQYLALVSDTHPRLFAGISDTTFSLKYNFHKETETSRLPALTISSFVQLPTGSASRGLGSGITDIGINGIAQKTVRKANIFRVNGGILFSGNTLTGAIGFTVIRGQVFTAGASYVRTLNEKLQMGVELTGAVANNFQLSKGQLQSQVGGNYQLSKKTTFDFGFIVGKFAASPRVGFQLGFSHDF